MTLTVRIIGLLGALIFGTGFALTFLSPIHYEKAARGFIESKIEQNLRDKLEFVPVATGEGRIAQLARKFAESHQDEIAALKQRLKSGLNEQIVKVVARMQNINCECRKRMTMMLNVGTKLQISSLERAEPQLRRIIEGRYGEIVADLLRDLRIFTGANLVAFLLLTWLSFAKPAYFRQLLVPGILLGIATVIASGFYLFGQNWFFTLLYNDYVGAAYAVWLLLIYGFLCDIALFKARITSGIVDMVTSLVANALSSPPC